MVTKENIKFTLFPRTELSGRSYDINIDNEYIPTPNIAIFVSLIISFLGRWYDKISLIFIVSNTSNPANQYVEF